MSHLTAEEFVDLMDGETDALAPARRAHLEGCDVCQEQAGSLTSVLARVVEADVPEPSPLFWDHLSARVRDGIAAPPARSWNERLFWPGSAWLAGLASVVLAVVVSHAMLPGAPLTSPRLATIAHAPAAVAATGASEPADDIEADEAWAVVRSVADDVAVDDAQDAGISTRPDAAERMTLELSTREQSELALLLRRELEHSGT